MSLTVKGKMITGIYDTAVGDAGGKYDLVGLADTDQGASQSVGFVVVWNNTTSGSSDSVTSWSGQYQVINGVETIVTTWLLTEETDPSEDWHSTLVNKDVFTRVPLTEEKIKENLDKGAKASFPKSLKK
ncbi:MAG TPA: avidin/streptavidin family protein [Chitinophaga sp.]|uniref:avidin/streptavidin family protein n=1 Tax=Chitinophaga sp. TaxID=1869181 RepID=UPI002BBCA937|nr:avidin/streptavidin family protein [Chitinophaga sp.]HVI48227.1 avidin/streptavidin family protein [Chitinophaga sp.]